MNSRSTTTPLRDVIIADAQARTQRVVVLGSTGSIGTQTLEIINHLNSYAPCKEEPFFDVVGLSAGGSSTATLEQQACAHPNAAIAVSRETDASFARSPMIGANAAEQLVRETEPDLVVSAIVGFSGLSATLAAVELGIDIALANKETLVAAGSVIVPLARKTGAKLLPVDSEHSGVWQCVQHLTPPCIFDETIRRVVLTASGGPLLHWSKEDTENAPIDKVLAHPTWNMGQKVTIDCASLTNKALELIEAHWLFGIPADKLGVIVHPQSIVHAMVEMQDNSIIAQLGSPDMRTPIQVALTHHHPSLQRILCPSASVDLVKLSQLTFIKPDRDRFPALDLADRVMRVGGTSGAVFNAANEVAVRAYINGLISFGMIPRMTRDVMDALSVEHVRSVDDVFAADTRARECAEKLIQAKAT
ncbi:MAG: 1-deoxy-D-xylulose-5-phosphate reductoisomerase [Phycisphaeraceae bacterium]|nr:1-deoxy-D-xylulose-5-phosphate reductoisomerase [Phycisphaerales bacterium]MCB9859969.1 1-deoxy-D-xylulose-5-phosphate reductoisomerase [Phycisphaeraceae bacterium]